MDARDIAVCLPVRDRLNAQHSEGQPGLASHRLPAHGQCLNMGGVRQNHHFYVIARKRLALGTDLETSVRSPASQSLVKRQYQDRRNDHVLSHADGAGSADQRLTRARSFRRQLLFSSRKV